MAELADAPSKQQGRADDAYVRKMLRRNLMRLREVL
jgi:hypothetical protein